MSSSVTETNLERKFQGVTNTQDSIQTLSLWLMHHKAHHKRIVTTWLKVLKKAKISQRLALFYLANDVIQNSKRKGVPFFKESFADVLREATLFVRDEQIKNSVNRVFKIWSERSIYDSDFISDLQGILANAKVPGTAPLKALAEFKCEKVIEKLKLVSKLEQEASVKLATVNISKLNATNSEIIQKLKDRTHGQQFSKEFDENTKCLEESIKTLNRVIQERNELMILLEQSQIYYDTQRGEAKIVSNAYKNFASRVKAVQKKLDEMMPTFGSPVPSPVPDAPSPTDSDMDLELPGEISPSEGREDEKKHDTSMSEMSLASMSFTSTVTTSYGHPIPTLSNLFTTVDQGKTASWFSSLAQKSSGTLQAITTTSPATTSDSGSLDSRLSSLLQNIPNLPSGLQDTLLGKSMSDSNSQSSVTPRRNTTGLYDVNAVVKDDFSGQNTPLQDEESPGTSAASSFFSNLAAAPKASQSPNDILKGLTNLIHTATSKDKSQKSSMDKALRWSLDTRNLFEKSSKASTLPSIIPSSVEPVIETSLSPPLMNPFFTTSSRMGSSNSSIKPSVSLSSFNPSPVTTLASSYSASSNVQGNLSYIPNIVPSAPNTTHFDYQPNPGYEEYDPCSANFKADNDTSSVGGISNPSPLSDSPSSPDEVLSGDDLEDTMNASRQSTLITLVSNTPVGTPVSEGNGDRVIPSSETAQITEVGWPNRTCQNSIKSLDSVTYCAPSKMEPMFSLPRVGITKNGCPAPENISVPVPEPWMSSKIETVQSPRNIRDNRWYADDRATFVPEPFSELYSSERETFNQEPVVHNYHHQSPAPPVNAWRGGRSRPFGNQKRGQTRKPFVPFSPRGRGRRFRPPLY